MTSRTGSATLAIAVAAIAALGAQTAPSEAAVTCAYIAATHETTVAMSAAGDSAKVARAGNELHVDNDACPGTPTVTNTAKIVWVDTSFGGTTAILDLSGGPLGPGFSPVAGDPSPAIPMQVTAGTGFDTFRVIGTDGNDFLAAGQAGKDTDVNLDYPSETALPDADATLKSIETVQFDGGKGDDTLTTDGGFGTGGVYMERGDIDGGIGDDVILGGEGGNVLRGGSGDDSITIPGDGYGVISPGTGDDKASAGSGTDDTLDYSDAPGGVSVDLSDSSPQVTGSAGTDTVSGFERLDGSPFDDRLTGTEDDNVLRGLAGADVLLGRGGSDLLIGDASLLDTTGIDTVSYADPSPGVTTGVTVSVATQGADQNTGSEGVDQIAGIANVIGSPFADTITGDAQANRIDAGGGADIITAAAGADTLLLRDGIGDTADCGTEGATVEADEQGLDTLTGCESVDFLVAPSPRRPVSQIRSPPRSSRPGRDRGADPRPTACWPSG